MTLTSQCHGLVYYITCTGGSASGNMLSRELMPLFLGLPRQNRPGQDLSMATRVILEASILSSLSCLRRGGEGRGGEGRGEVCANII